MLRFKDPKPYILDHNALRNEMNKPKTTGLFYETAPKKMIMEYYKNNKGTPPIFTIDNEFDLEYTATDNYPDRYYWSLRRLYLEAKDPNEYTFAKTVFGSWDQWSKLLGNKTVRAYIDKWREELEYLLTSEGCHSLIKKASEGDVNASKFIATKNWQKVYNKVESSPLNKSSEESNIHSDYERLKSLGSKPKLVSSRS